MCKTSNKKQKLKLELRVLRQIVLAEHFRERAWPQTAAAGKKEPTGMKPVGAKLLLRSTN